MSRQHASRRAQDTAANLGARSAISDTSRLPTGAVLLGAAVVLVPWWALLATGATRLYTAVFG